MISQPFRGKFVVAISKDYFIEATECGQKKWANNWGTSLNGEWKNTVTSPSCKSSLSTNKLTEQCFPAKMQAALVNFGRLCSCRDSQKKVLLFSLGKESSSTKMTKFNDLLMYKQINYFTLAAAFWLAIEIYKKEFISKFLSFHLCHLDMLRQ